MILYTLIVLVMTLTDKNVVTNTSQLSVSGFHSYMSCADAGKAYSDNFQGKNITVSAICVPMQRPK